MYPTGKHDYIKLAVWADKEWSLSSGSVEGPTNPHREKSTPLEMQHATLLYSYSGRRVKEGEMDEAWKWREIVTEFW